MIGDVSDLVDQLTVTADDLAVAVRIITEADRRGSHGRLLVYVSRDGERSFNGELIERDYTRTYDSSFAKRDSFATPEATDRENVVGLWNYGVAPSETRTRTASPTLTSAPDGGTSTSEFRRGSGEPQVGSSSENGCPGKIRSRRPHPVNDEVSDTREYLSVTTGSGFWLPKFRESHLRISVRLTVTRASMFDEIEETSLQEDPHPDRSYSVAMVST